MQYIAVHYSTLQYNAVQCSAVQYSAVQYSAVHCSAKRQKIYNIRCYGTRQMPHRLCTRACHPQGDHAPGHTTHKDTVHQGIPSTGRPCTRAYHLHKRHQLICYILCLASQGQPLPWVVCPGMQSPMGGVPSDTVYEALFDYFLSNILGSMSLGWVSHVFTNLLTFPTFSKLDKQYFEDFPK